MSASEKLKALDEEATNGPWEKDGWMVYAARTDTTRYNVAETHTVMVDGDLIAALRNALPQIVALVEAAQRGSALMRYVYGERGRDDTDADVWDWLDQQDAALTALEEALS